MAPDLLTTLVDQMHEERNRLLAQVREQRGGDLGRQEASHGGMHTATL